MSIEKFGDVEYKKAESDYEYAIPMHKYVGRNSYDCPREKCLPLFRDQTEFKAHLNVCCPGLLDEFPTYLGCLVDDGNGNLFYDPAAIQQYISEHPPLK